MKANPIRRRAVLPGIIALLLMLSPIALVTATAPQTVTSSIARAAAATPPHAPEFSGCGGINQPVVNADYEQQVVDLVNSRARQSRTAALQARDGARRSGALSLGRSGTGQLFRTTTPTIAWAAILSTSATRGRASARIIAGASGENIAAGYSTPQRCDERLDEQHRPSR